MPIIPSNWTSLSTVNAITSGGSSKPFKYVKTFTINSDNLTDYQPLIGYCSEDINREFSVEIISGKIDFYWVNQLGELFVISQDELITGDELKDTDLDCLGVSFKCHENSEFFVTLRWDSDIDFYIYSEQTDPPITENNFWDNIINPDNWADSLNVISIPIKPVYLAVFEGGTFTDELWLLPLNGSDTERLIGLTDNLSVFNDYSNLWNNIQIGEYYFYTPGEYSNYLSVTGITQESNRWVIYLE